jgi:hypothetical protein
MEYDRAILPTLYGLYVDERNEYNGEIIYSIGVDVKRMLSVTKNNGAKISLGFFANEQMKEVSAVLFSCAATYSKLAAMSPRSNTLTLFTSLITDENEMLYFFPNVHSDEYHENIQDGVCILHNPFAEYPLPKGIFREIGINNYTYLPEYGIFLREKNHHFLVVRTAFFYTGFLDKIQQVKVQIQKTQ